MRTRYSVSVTGHLMLGEQTSVGIDICWWCGLQIKFVERAFGRPQKSWVHINMPSHRTPHYANPVYVIDELP